MFTPNLTPTLRGSTRATVFALFLGLRRTLRQPYASLRAQGFRKNTLYAKSYADLTRPYAQHCFWPVLAAPWSLLTPNLTPSLRVLTPTSVLAWWGGSWGCCGHLDVAIHCRPGAQKMQSSLRRAYAELTRCIRLWLWLQGGARHWALSSSWSSGSALVGSWITLGSSWIALRSSRSALGAFLETPGGLLERS